MFRQANVDDLDRIGDESYVAVISTLIQDGRAIRIASIKVH